MSVNNKKRDDFNYYLTDEDLDRIYNDRDNAASTLVEEYTILRDKYIKIMGRLADRVEIERAKDIIRDRMKCTGDAAMIFIKRLACSQNMNMGQAAQLVIRTKDALDMFAQGVA